MKVFSRLEDWSVFRRQLPPGGPGFVATMGALHAGHLSLVKRSQRENQHTVVSLFVNPTQFDQPQDLEAYPSQQQQDLDLLSGLGVDAVLMPDYASLYPDDYRYRVSESVLSQQFCGAHRPGHFDGMLTVVMRLFNLVSPGRAYFGEKDFQQLQLVRGMVQAFFMDIEVIACPTVREADGLAMSSRNQRLDEQQRRMAARLNQILARSGSEAEAARALNEAGFRVDYVSDLDGRRLAAVWLGDTRLIDNLPLDGGKDS